MSKDAGSEGLVIMAFPCNQFGGQEPGSNADIKAFATKLGVPDNDSFMMMNKVDVNGRDTHPVYQFLKAATADSSDIKWNFASYWLVDRYGSVQRLKGAGTTPKKSAEKVAAALSAE
ncbi:unnamed protein product [Prorocentrum cordatum]|uniref:Glutathione peroxidase n=1 Tax=Prorocentrum cordatum TaxID=2364126 RepID=A0ABN9PEY1_9DINO|nr:unnamed protein product [Polarella glacialis]|mmetsp:Transcript_18588/g.49977  ORF Transcript_18588/g.49977 Transcript_18588/m.49977 type:complete len:117 (+) Transcript_18588:164-514(+)